jgi:hypothetical protein
LIGRFIGASECVEDSAGCAGPFGRTRRWLLSDGGNESDAAPFGAIRRLSVVAVPADSDDPVPQRLARFESVEVVEEVADELLELVVAAAGGVGVMKQLGAVQSGWSGGSGSGSVTSRYAAARRPAESASTRAPWSTVVPRPML